MVIIPDRLGGRYYAFTRAALWLLRLEGPSEDSQTVNDAGWNARRGARLLRASGQPRAHDKVASRVATAGDAGALGQMMRVPAEKVRDRIGHGKRCYVTEEAGRLVSYGWVTLGPEDIPELERGVHPGRGDAYIWDCYTMPERRGQGLLPAMLRDIAIDLRRQGLQRAWAVILSGNRASRRAFARAGFEMVADLLYVRLLFFRRLVVLGRKGQARQLVDAARKVLR